MNAINSFKKSRYVQYISAATASLSFASTMLYVSWSSPTLPNLTKDEAYAGIKLTPSESSWLVSAYFVGLTIGGVPSALLLNTLGRKNSLLLGGSILLIPWVPLTFPPNALVMILARLVAGLGGGFVMTNISIYIGEIADKDIRGRLIVINSFISACGSILIFCIGPFVSYKVLNAISASIPVLFIGMFVFAPESPYSLIKKNRFLCAKKSLQRLRNCYEDAYIDSQYEEIKNDVAENLKNKVDFKTVFSKREYRKSIWIMLGVRTFHQLSGMSALDSYMQTIVEMSDIGLSSQWVSVTYGAVQLPIFFLSAYCVDRVGRKPLLSGSFLGEFVVLTVLGTFFYLKNETNVNLTNIQYLPAVCMLLYMTILPIGIQSLPFVIFGELFAMNLKQIGGVLFTFYGCALAFFVVKIFGPISEGLGVHVVFWFFAACCFVGAFFVIWAVPETKNKTFNEIQIKLSKK